MDPPRLPTHPRRLGRGALSGPDTAPWGSGWALPRALRMGSSALDCHRMTVITSRRTGVRPTGSRRVQAAEKGSWCEGALGVSLSEGSHGQTDYRLALGDGQAGT